MIKKISTADREAWKSLRHGYIGGSDAASVVGLNPFKSAYALWAEKTDKAPLFGGNLATEVGSFLEEFVAQKFAEQTGKKVRKVNQSFLNDAYPFAIANIDRDIVGEDAGLEIKTTSEMNLTKFKNGEYPANYYVQCVHYLAVTGKAKWYLAVLIGNREFRTFEIERDEAEINALMSAEKDFWELVKTDTPPAPDGSDSTSETISVIYPESDDETVDLTAYEGDMKQYIALTSQIKGLTAIKDELANKVKAYMGKAGRGVSEGFKVAYTSAVRNTFDAKRFSADYPNMDLSGYYKQSSVRTFRLTEIQ